MTKYYYEFQKLLQVKISDLEKIKNINLSGEQRFKLTEAVRLLWLYDLRKITSDQKYYLLIIENVFNSIVANTPIQLIQFACPTRNNVGISNLKEVEDYLVLDPLQNGLGDNLPFLKLLFKEFESRDISLQIKVFLADTSIFWMNLSQGKAVNLNPAKLLEKLVPRFKDAKDSLQDYVTETTGLCRDTLEIISYFEYEKQIEIVANQNYFERWNLMRDKVITEAEQSIEIRQRVLFNSIRTAFINEGMAKNKAVAQAEIKVKYLNLEKPASLDEIQIAIGERVMELGLVWEIEYRINGIDFELCYPNAILIQTESPAQLKSDLYSKYRNTILPNISRVMQ